MSASEPTVVRGACHHDCPDTCGWEVTVVDGTAVKLRGSEEHPFTRGELCPKVNRFLDRVYHPDRLTTPMRRVGPKGSGQFEPFSWDEAIGEIAARFSEIRSRSGAEAIMPYSFAGTQGLVQMGIMASRFFDELGATRLARHLCGVTAWLGAAEVHGTPFGIDPEDLRHSKTIILWGTNTYLTNRHLWPTIEAARDQGATVIVIDPIKTITAGRADRFVQLRPGTDVALVLAMINVLIEEGLVDHDWLDSNTSGWAELAESARAMAPKKASEICGVPEQTIIWLARTFATETPAAIRTLIGPEHREHGQEIMRAISLLPAVTGAGREVGGGLARSTSVYFDAALNTPAALNPAGRQFNMAALGEVLLNDELDPPIEALFVHNSNPAAICPDQNRVIAGLERDDLFCVVVEQFMTDTARYADILLPATTQLEHLDLGNAWGHLYLSLNQPAIAPVGEALPNTEIFRRLAAELGLSDPMFTMSDEDLVRLLLDSDHEWLDGITYERLESDGWVRLNVEGAPSDELRLGPLSYQAASESGGPEHEYPLALMTIKQHAKFLNANYGGFEKHYPPSGKPGLEIHTADAEPRGISDGDTVKVFNHRGSLTLRAEISDRVQPGLVSTPFGWWNRHTPQDRGANALTNPSVNEDGIGSAAFFDTQVEVERV